MGKLESKLVFLHKHYRPWHLYVELIKRKLVMPQSSCRILSIFPREKVIKNYERSRNRSQTQFVWLIMSWSWASAGMKIKSADIFIFPGSSCRSNAENAHSLLQNLLFHSGWEWSDSSSGQPAFSLAWGRRCHSCHCALVTPAQFLLPVPLPSCQSITFNCREVPRCAAVGLPSGWLFTAKPWH